MNARRTPERVGRGHFYDQTLELPIEAWPAGNSPALSPPIRTKTLPVPSDNCFRLHDRESLSPAAPKSAERDPEQPISIPNFRPRDAALEHIDLLPEGQILEHEITPRPARGPEESS